MTVVSVLAKINTDDLLAAIEQLEPAEAEKVTRRLLHSQARRKASNLSAREAELLREIYREKRPGFQDRFDLLSQKIRAFTLTPEEHAELLGLVDESEAFTMRRMEAMGELAMLRQMTLRALMKRLGLKTPPVV